MGSCDKNLHQIWYTSGAYYFTGHYESMDQVRDATLWVAATGSQSVHTPVSGEQYINLCSVQWRSTSGLYKLVATWHLFSDDAESNNYHSNDIFVNPSHPRWAVPLHFVSVMQITSFFCGLQKHRQVRLYALYCTRRAPVQNEICFSLHVRIFTKCLTITLHPRASKS